MKSKTYCIVEKCQVGYSLITTVTGHKQARQEAEPHQHVWSLKHWNDYQAALIPDTASVGEYIKA